MTSTMTPQATDNANHFDMEDRLRQKDSRIAVLERQKQRQTEELNLLRSEIGAAQIKHKEDIYWMRLECDSLRRDKEAAEDRMSELLRDMREMETQVGNPEELPPSIDAPYVLHIQSQLSKSMQTVGILDNQISMVKKSCDEVVKSLKEEIGDVMDDKCRMEMELMNQMATLDNEKRQLQIAYDEHTKNGKQGDNDMDVPQHGGGDSDDVQVKKLMKMIESLEKDKAKLYKQLSEIEHESSDEVAKLEEKNTELGQQVEKLSGELEEAKKKGASDAVRAIDSLTSDRQETMETLERVAHVWEKADDSIQALEDVIDKLKPSEDQDVGHEGERLLSTLETASLVHGQVKVALLLIELKLRNQLGSIKNDKGRTSTSSRGSTVDLKIMEKMREIQEEAVAAMEQVEESLSEQIKHLGDEQGSSQLEESLMVKTRDLKRMRTQYEKLQDEVSTLRSSKGTSERLGVSKSVMERLQNEVLTVAQRVKDKNETIERLTADVKEHKVREAALKKEMKRLLKRRS